MPRTPEEMWAAIIKNMPAKTGKALDEWMAIVASAGPQTRKDRIAWLKDNYGLSHGYAQVVADQMAKPDWVTKTPGQLLDDQYAGEKARLRPVYERVVEAVRALGEEVTVEPRKTYVSLSRRRQFGVVQATSRERVSLGLALPGAAFGGRLLAAGGLGNERITHRVELGRPEDVDDEVRGWLAAAYAADDASPKQ